MREISQRHRSLCHYIARYTQTHGWPPSRREIKQALGFTSTSHVAYYLETLEQQGYLHCQPHVSRGMTLTPTGHVLAQQVSERESGQRRFDPSTREQQRHARQRRTFSRPGPQLSST
jgi:SOS-response transcriptional repressor LexA